MKKRKVIRPKTHKVKNNKNKYGFWGILISICVLLFFLFYKEKNEIKLKLEKKEFLKNIPKDFESVGIDISHHQGKINWEKLLFKNSYDTIIRFVYCKASEGITHKDREWDNNRKWLLANGIYHGAYHFYLPSEDPILQAKHFLSQWKKKDGDLPPVLDVEVENKNDINFIKNIKIWLFEVEKKTGMRPIIYTPLNFYENKFQNEFKNYKFWIAAYSKKPSCINDERILHWQFSETGNLPGIDENVDINVSKIKF